MIFSNEFGFAILVVEKGHFWCKTGCIRFFLSQYLLTSNDSYKHLDWKCIVHFLILRHRPSEDFSSFFLKKQNNNVPRYGYNEEKYVKKTKNTPEYERKNRESQVLRCM